MAGQLEERQAEALLVAQRQIPRAEAQLPADRLAEALQVAAEPAAETIRLRTLAGLLRFRPAAMTVAASVMEAAPAGIRVVSSVQTQAGRLEELQAETPLVVERFRGIRAGLLAERQAETLLEARQAELSPAEVTMAAPRRRLLAATMAARSRITAEPTETTAEALLPVRPGEVMMAEVLRPAAQLQALALQPLQMDQDRLREITRAEALRRALSPGMTGAQSAPLLEKIREMMAAPSPITAGPTEMTAEALLPVRPAEVMMAEARLLLWEELRARLLAGPLAAALPVAGRPAMGEAQRLGDRLVEEALAAMTAVA